MKFKVIEQTRRNNRTYEPGETVELTEAEAKYLVLSGQIAPVEADPKTKAKS